MRSHLISDDLEPAQWPAVIARNARIDAREAPTVRDLNTLQARRVRDDEALCAVGGEDRCELLLLCERRSWRRDGGPDLLRVGIGLDQASVPERPEGGAEHRLFVIITRGHRRRDAIVDVGKRLLRIFRANAAVNEQG